MLVILCVLRLDTNPVEQEERQKHDGSSQQQVTDKGGNKATCPTMTFSPRTPSESSTARTLWNDTVEYVKRNKLTFLKNETLKMHAEYLSEIEEKGVSGMILETGVAKAGSSLTFCAIKHTSRCLHLYDTFSGIPPPSDKDGDDVHKRYEDIRSGKGGEDYYGYMSNLLEYDSNHFVQAHLDPEQHSVFFHKGLFHDTVWPDGAVAYAHLDGDWYESTFEMLHRVVPWLSSDGGILTLDDAHHFSGARRAFEDYFHVGTKWLEETHMGRAVGCIVFLRDSKRYALFRTVRYGVRVVGKDEEVPECKRIR